MEYYPIYLNLKDRNCVVIGGNHEAESKVAGLLDAEARVTVIWPDPNVGLLKLADKGRLTLHLRDYQPGDLAGAFLVICTVRIAPLNEQVWQEAQTRNTLINVMDDIPHCNFIAPSIVRRGDLTLAISTNGKAPALAVRLRQWLERMLGEEYARFLTLAGTLRAPLAARYPDFTTRKEMWYALVDSDVLELLREGKEPEAQRRITEITRVAPQ